MIAVNTSISAIFTQYASRANQLEMRERVERLSTGSRINKAADDPSGLAISQGMKSQMHGVQVAIGNAQETSHMLRLIDEFINTVQDILMDARDKSLRLANQATTANNPTGVPGTPPLVHDCMELHKEIEKMKYSISTMFIKQPVTGLNEVPMLNFNGKNIFDGTGLQLVDDLQRGFSTGQVAQIGPDNGSPNQMTITIDDLASFFLAWRVAYDPPPNPDGNDSSAAYAQFAQSMVEDIDVKLDNLGNLRTQLGTQTIQLQHAINDLQVEYLNVSGSRSRITDADMAVEITKTTKNQIRQQSIDMIAQQANAIPTLTIPLLEAIYDGLSKKMIYTGSGS